MAIRGTQEHFNELQFFNYYRLSIQPSEDSMQRIVGQSLVAAGVFASILFTGVGVAAADPPPTGPTPSSSTGPSADPPTCGPTLNRLSIATGQPQMPQCG